MTADWSTRPPGRCLVMGILNVTPDSFSDGGQYADPEVAVAHGAAMIAAGADIIDIGGESTRPGAHRISDAEELRRVIPVVRELAAAGLPVSIDTMRAPTAEAAVAAGAQVVNDVSGGLADPAMARCVAELRVPYVAMHWRAPSAVMEQHTHYDGDVVAVVRAELDRRVDELVAAGVDFDRIVIDPGIGFAKDATHNWTLLARLPELSAGLGRPILVGASRKRFLRRAAGAAALDTATAAVSALAANAGAACVRVHDVAATIAAVRVAEHWRPNVARPAGH
ncbi:dihydropteroate synthase [Mycolicibacterium sp.]|uniref:dihydropteroate synthase n=1 Tax=Mycolicibacterium sp. TaxID=2320850 RepID=UPI003D14422D